MNAYLLLGIAIVSEVFGTSCMKASEGFTKLLPSLGTAAGFAVAFYCLSLVLKTIPLGVAYAVWAGVGIVLTAIVGIVMFKQSLDLPAYLGIALIVAGVVVMRVFSTAGAH